MRAVTKTLEAAEANWAGTNAGGRLAYMADALVSAQLVQSPETAAEPQEPRRGPLWSLLEWSLWGAGMGDVFRLPLADTMLAAVSPETQAQAEQIMADFIERRKIEKTGVTVYQEQRDELERLRSEVAALRAERHSTNESLSEAAEQLRADRDRISELEAAAYGDATVRLLAPVEQIRHLHACVAAQLHRADTLNRLCQEQRVRADVAEQSPLAWADRLDAKSLDNLLISLGSASEHEPMDEAIGQIHQILAGFRSAALDLPVGAPAEAPPLTVFRASHDSIVMDLYTTATEARKHCEAEERRSWGAGHTLVFDWIEDDEDRVAELVVTAGQNEESTTGYVVEAVEVASAYDPDADE